MAEPTTTPGVSIEANKRRLEEILAEREIDYWDIVWGQLRKDRTAMFGLWLIGALFLAAIFAPAIACHLPYTYVEDGSLRLPWYRYLLNMESSVDHVFNVAMLLLVPWVALGFLARGRRREGLSTRRLLAGHVVPFAIVLAAVVAQTVFRDTVPAPTGKGTIPVANTFRGAFLQILFFLTLVWVGQGWVAWSLGRGRRTAKRRVGLQFAAFLIALVAAGAATRPALYFKEGPYPRFNVLRPTYDLKDIEREGYFRSEEFAGRGFWPPIRHSYLDQDREHTNMPPHEGQAIGHYLGTNGNGYDILAQLIYGARIALTIGFVGVGIYMVIGTILGALAGYFAGWIDIVISRFVEIMITFPSFFLILVLVALLQARPEVRENLPPIFLIMIVIGIVGWTHEARLIRGEFLRLRNQEFVLAARALGVSNLRIIFRHILPNAIAPALVAATFGVGSAILTEGALSFLGIGISPPVPSWGKMLRDGYDNPEFLFLFTPPAFMIFVTVTAYNLVGEGLRDSLDPRLRK